jgi:hypothetical protein
MSPEELLQKVLQDPLGLESREHVAAWLKTLRTKFPLWSFQASAYVRLHGGFPTAYPLQTLINSILSDESIEEQGASLTPLEHCVDVRRIRLAKGTHLRDPDWCTRPPVHASRFAALDARSMAVGVDAKDSHDPDTPGYVSPYEKIGERYVEMIEDWVAARDKRERAWAGGRMRGFRDYMASALGVVVKKNLPQGPHKDMLKALVSELRSLLGLCWSIFPIKTGSRVAAELAGQGVTGPREQQIWSARLALPVFSAPEVSALRSETEKATRLRKRGGSYPTARRYAVWVAAHRLQLDPRSLAGKALNRDAETYFLNEDNPIEQFVEY